MSRLRIAAQLACWAAVGLVPLSAYAQSTWLQTAGGTYSWQTVANWITNPTGAGAVANLTSDIAAKQQVTLDAAVTLGTLGNAPVAPGTYTDGFFTDLPGDFLSSVSGGDFRYWVRGIFGGTQQTFDGVVYSPLSAFDPSLSVTLATAPFTAGFAGGAIDGQSMQLVVVPESDGLALAALDGLIALARLSRCGRRGTCHPC